MKNVFPATLQLVCLPNHLMFSGNINARRSSFHRLHNQWFGKHLRRSLAYVNDLFCHLSGFGMRHRLHQRWNPKLLLNTQQDAPKSEMPLCCRFEQINSMTKFSHVHVLNGTFVAEGEFLQVVKKNFRKLCCRNLCWKHYFRRRFLSEFCIVVYARGVPQIKILIIPPHNKTWQLYNLWSIITSVYKSRAIAKKIYYSSLAIREKELVVACMHSRGPKTIDQ